MVLTIDKNNDLNLLWTNETEQGLLAIKNFNPLTDLQHDFMINDCDGKELASLSIQYDIIEACGYGLLKNIFISGGHNIKNYLDEFSEIIKDKWSRWDTIVIGSTDHISKLHSNCSEWFYTDLLNTNTSYDEVKVLIKHGTPIKTKKRYLQTNIIEENLPFGRIEVPTEKYVFHYDNELYELVTSVFNEDDIIKALLNVEYQRKPKQLLISGQSVFIKIGELNH
ncbi:hypothetical protein ABC382_00965 [Lysinibacillus sp. 1P01SD]|uniref:hypothetical protein n=1 Tax=Lysinibacillus sp. 1P01SD TaxID=3132285 RepID=UPI0039A3E47B